MLTISDVRKLVGLQAGDVSRDDRLTHLIDAAYETAEHYLGPLQVITVTETVSVSGGLALLSHQNVQSVVSVSGLSDLAGVRVTGAGVVTGLTFSPSPWGPSSVVITYLAGFTVVPALVEEGLRLWVRHRWTLESYGTDTYGSPDVDVADFDGLPNAVSNAWAPYMRASSGLIA